MKVNPQKTQLINFNHLILRDRQFVIRMNREPIEEVQSLKYLGVHVDRKLLYNYHIQQVISRATAATKLIDPLITKYSLLTEQMKVQLYIASIRSILSYEILRIILYKRSTKINNKYLYKHFNPVPISTKLCQNTERFFTYDKYKSKLSENLGRDTHSDFRNLPKFKLIHHKLLMR